MAENHPTLGRNEKDTIKEHTGELGFTRLRGCHHIGVKLPSQLAQHLRLRTRDIDSDLLSVFFVVPVKHLIRKALQSAFGYYNQTYWQIQAGQPTRRRTYLVQMLKILGNLFSLQHASYC